MPSLSYSMLVLFLKLGVSYFHMLAAGRIGAPQLLLRKQNLMYAPLLCACLPIVVS